MEIAVFPDTFQVLAKHLFHRALETNHLSVAASGNLQASALLSAIDVVAPPPARSTTSSRTLLKRRRCRTRKRRRSSGKSEDDGFFDDVGGGDDDDGPFGGSGGGGRWNFDGYGGFGWDDSSSSPADPAFDFFYEVVCWLVFSNCLHFAYKRAVRMLAQSCVDHGRQKVPMRLTSVC